MKFNFGMDLDSTFFYGNDTTRQGTPNTNSKLVLLKSTRFSLELKGLKETVENWNACLKQSIDFEAMHPIHFKLLKRTVTNFGSDEYK